MARVRELVARLAEEMPSVSVGVGVSAGPAVAGWVGAEQRFEYTVIGDPVNEAARLCDLAKVVPGGILASSPTVAGADPAEAAHWCDGDEVVLRGRSAPTRLSAPAVTTGG